MFAKAFHALPVPALVFDDGGQVLAVNERMRHLLGNSPEVAWPQSLAEVSSTEQIAQWGASLRQLAEGQSHHWSGAWRRHDASPLMVDADFALMGDAARRVYCVTVAAHADQPGDVVALRRNDQRFRQPAAAAHIGVFSCSRSTGEVFWSRELRAMAGIVAPEAVSPLGWLKQHVSPGSRAGVRDLMRQAFRRDGDGTFEGDVCVMCPSDGRIRYLRVKGQVSFEQRAHRRWACEASGAVMDRTGGMQLKADIAHLEQRFSLALHAAPIMFFEQDTSLRYNWVFNSQLGSPGECILGKTDFDLVAPPQAVALDAFKRQVMETGNPQRREMAIAMPQGSLQYFDMSIEPLRNASGQIIGIVGTALNVDASRRATLGLAERTAQLKLRTLEVESANEICSRFLSTVSHELRTPLHTMLGYLRMAMARSQGEVYAQLEIVERSGRQLVKQIGDLNRLDDRVVNLQGEPVHLLDVVEQLWRTGQILAVSGSNHFTMDIAPDLPRVVHIDKYRLLQVLDNLIGNACKYTQGGSIVLQIAREPISQDFFQEGAVELTSNRVRFTVRDTGIGIAPQELGAIFDAYIRSGNTQQLPGLGLGLSIARRWVRAMGGEIHVESAPGKGSRFWFVLDLPEAGHSAHRTTFRCSTSVAALDGRLRTILVVDDVPENRVLMGRICADWGYAVMEAESGARALALCAPDQSRPDAVLIDQYMPDMTGWELLSRLHAMPHMRAVSSVLVSASVPERAHNLPADVRFDLELEKPVDYERLACFLCQRLACAVCPARPDAAAVRMVGKRFHPPLPLSDWNEFADLLHMGRVVRIQEWAQKLMKREPLHAPLCQEVIALARAADLDQLGLLLAAVMQGP